MAEDVPYLVYVGDKIPLGARKSASQPQRTFLEPDVANDPEGCGDVEYLDFSTEEEFDSNTEDDEPEFNNGVEVMAVEEPTIKRENEKEDKVIEEEEANEQQVSSKWSHAATINMIETFQSYETSLITGTMKISEVWDAVASKLQENGYNFTAMQCRNKFISLKQIYEKIQEQKMHSGKSVKKWMYMDSMEPIVTNMDKYKNYAMDAWDSLKRNDFEDNTLNQDSKNSDQSVQGIHKWENSAILLLIDQYRKYERALESGNISKKHLFRLIEKTMQNEGYNVTAKQCLIKYHTLKRTYKSIKEHNRVNRLIPRRWRYYDLIESLEQRTPDTSCDVDPLGEVSETLAEIKSEETQPHVFKWCRRAIEILVAAYREHRPPLHDSKVSRNKVWQIVAHKLRKAGYNVSIEQCKSKIGGMLKLYKRNRAGACSRAWNGRGNWYSKLIESIVEKTPKSVQREVPEKAHPEVLSSEAGTAIKRADNMLDQLIICEENKERRHRENREQRQQLIDIMRRLVDKL